MSGFDSVRSVLTCGALAVAMVGVASAQDVGSKFVLEVEGGPVWQSRNDVQIPNDDTGTRFSLVDLVGRGSMAWRHVFYFTWNISDRHGPRALLAPLSYTETGTFDEPVNFVGETYQPGASHRSHLPVQLVAARPTATSSTGATAGSGGSASRPRCATPRSSSARAKPPARTPTWASCRCSTGSRLAVRRTVASTARPRRAGRRAGPRRGPVPEGRLRHQPALDRHRRVPDRRGRRRHRRGLQLRVVPFRRRVGGLSILRFRLGWPRRPAVVTRWRRSDEIPHRPFGPRSG